MEKKNNIDGEQYQTPPEICKYMVSLVPGWAEEILEPTPGKGNLVKAIQDAGEFQLTAPEDYFKLDKNARFDCIVMNPPFSSKFAFGVPPEVEETGMKLGYYILEDCMRRSDNIIALMPWFTISDSDVRLRKLVDFGLKSLTSLPRKTFNYIRIQTVVIELERGFNGDTIFKTLR